MSTVATFSVDRPWVLGMMLKCLGLSVPSQLTCHITWASGATHERPARVNPGSSLRGVRTSLQARKGGRPRKSWRNLVTVPSVILGMVRRPVE